MVKPSVCLTALHVVKACRVGGDTAVLIKLCSGWRRVDSFTSRPLIPSERDLRYSFYGRPACEL